MSGASKEHMRTRKEWASVSQQLLDQKGEMSALQELNLLLIKKGLSEEILSDLKEEKRILKDDICSWETDIEKLQRKISRRENPLCFDVSSDEEQDAEESESENSPDEDEKEDTEDKYVSMCGRSSSSSEEDSSSEESK